MELAIFNDVTTESVLQDLEAEAESYTGLYVDMNEAKGRKFVKEQAATISDILKRLDRARIDKAKEYKQAVEFEAGLIRQRLEKANEPFTLLINEHNAERKRILDAEKAKQKAIDDAKAEELRRINDIENQKAVNNAALDCLVAGGVDAEQAKLVIKLIAARKVAHVQINY